MVRKPTARESLHFFVGLAIAGGLCLGILLNYRIRQNERLDRALNRIAALEVSVEGLAAMTAEPRPAEPRAEQIVQSLAEAFSTDAEGIAKLAAIIKAAGSFVLTTGERQITIQIDTDLEALGAALGMPDSTGAFASRIRGTLKLRPATQASRPSTRPRDDDGGENPTGPSGASELIRRGQTTQRLREIGEAMKAYVGEFEPYPALLPTTLPSPD